MNSYGWLASLIEVNNLKEQLIVGDVEKKLLKKIINVNGEIDGNVLYATDNVFKIDGNVFHWMVRFICRMESFQLFLDPVGMVREKGGAEKCK